MKKSFLILLVFGSFLVSQAFALPVPMPIKGTANHFIGRIVSGDYEIIFKFPPGWGIGELSINRGSGFFTLFPLSGGIGCSIETSQFESEGLAKEAIVDLRKTFSGAKNVNNGFEVEFPKAWYYCQANGKLLIQTWYSVPKKTKQLAQLWEILKQSVSALEITQEPWKDSSQPFSPLTEIRYKGWFCHHENNKLHVLFESFPLLTCTPKQDPSASYVLKFSGHKGEGFFFVKWDQTEFEKNETYQRHLEEMLQDIKKIEPNQMIAKDLKFNLNNGYAVLQGNPYILVTIKGDGFLYGFAVKPENAFLGYDFNDLVRRVGWKKDE